MFNYLNRVADAVGIELDYPSPLPRPPKDPAREPLPRPAEREWPRGSADRTLASLVPVIAERFADWSRYLFERDAPLSRRERQVIARAVEAALCDRGEDGASDGEPHGARERTLAAFATELTCVPWRLDAASLSPLRALGLDDAGLLDVIAVASHQNAASRVRLALAVL